MNTTKKYVFLHFIGVFWRLIYAIFPGKRMPVDTDIESIKVTKSNKLNETTMLSVSKERPLSANEQKLYLAVISQIKLDDEAFKVYRIAIPDLVKLTGISRHNMYRDIDRMCLSLMMPSIKIHKPDEPGGFLRSAWFADAEYKPFAGCVEFSISPKLKPYLVNLKERFTTYHLKQIINLKSSYSIRIYETLRQYLSIKAVKNGQSENTLFLNVEALRGYLGVHEKYPRFTDFKRHVIDPSQKELSERTDLRFEYEVKRKGRKIEKLAFKIIDNTHVDSPEEEQGDTDMCAPVDNLNPDVEVDENILKTLQMMLPDVDEMLLKLLIMTTAKDVLTESLMDFARSKMSGVVIDNDMAYLQGILKKKRESQAVVEKTAEARTYSDEEAMDRSWIGKYDFDFDGED